MKPHSKIVFVVLSSTTVMILEFKGENSHLVKEAELLVGVRHKKSRVYFELKS